MFEESQSTIQMGNIDPIELPPEGTSHTESLGPESHLIPDGVYPPYANPNYVMPNEIQVYVRASTGDYVIPVSIVKKTIRKLYLGGYRNTKSGKVYHHCSTQTPREEKVIINKNLNKNTRETQTKELRTCSVQPIREQGTQMERIDVSISTSKDKVKIAKKYFTADELLAKKKLMTVEIQRVWRGYMARCRAILQRAYIKEYDNHREQESLDLQREMQTIRLKELEKKNHPKCKADFARLFNELDTWRRNETARIKLAYPHGEERRLAMAALLAEETKTLQNIQQLKATAYQDINAHKTVQMLELMSTPAQWQLSTGLSASVQTPETTKAKELLDAYKSISAPVTSIEQRLEALLGVKWIVRETLDSGLTSSGLSLTVLKDILDLIDREADLLNRGRSISSMEKLRIRIQHMFLQFIEDPVFNPRSKEFIGIPLPPPPMNN